VKSLPLEILRWGVVDIVTYTGAAMLRAALTRTPATAPSDEAPAELPGEPPAIAAAIAAMGRGW
jgi:hypothetical protein